MPEAIGTTWTCPLPLRDYPTIVIGHGGGGQLGNELVEHLFKPAFSNDVLDRMADSAVLTLPPAALRIPRTVSWCVRLNFLVAALARWP